jgi:cytochrome c oxidase subunit 2
MRSRATARASGAAGLALLAGACAGAPSYMRPAGTAAAKEASLGWYLIVVACAVVLIITLLVVIGAFRGRGTGAANEVRRSGPGLPWVTIGGIAIPVLILLVTLVLTLGTLNAVDRPPAGASPWTVTVTGHRWWWEVRYAGRDAHDVATTANEIHIPVGQPVRFTLVGGDVIHSFWVPELAGKTDVIPGQTNTMWLDATRPGTYVGRCAEYCGLEHARMAFVVVADPPGEFAEWLARQETPASPPTDELAKRGHDVFVGGPCALCHTIQGTTAAGRQGPDLTHIASRRTIAAGTLPNTRGNLAGWVANAQGIKPGTLMPKLTLTPTELQAVVAYLETLN